MLEINNNISFIDSQVMVSARPVHVSDRNLKERFILF